MIAAASGLSFPFCVVYVIILPTCESEAFSSGGVGGGNVGLELKCEMEHKDR